MKRSLKYFIDLTADYPGILPLVKSGRLAPVKGRLANEEEARLGNSGSVDVEPGVELHLVHVFVENLDALGAARQAGPFRRAGASSEISQHRRGSWKEFRHKQLLLDQK